MSEEGSFHGGGGGGRAGSSVTGWAMLIKVFEAVMRRQMAAAKLM